LQEGIFKPGDRVCWTKAILIPPTRREIPGTVLQVMPSTDGSAFTLYQVQFEFGIFVLYGAQLDPALETLSRSKGSVTS
jgi:hypothetical protein